MIGNVFFVKGNAKRVWSERDVRVTRKKYYREKVPFDVTASSEPEWKYEKNRNSRDEQEKCEELKKAHTTRVRLYCSSLAVALL